MAPAHARTSLSGHLAYIAAYRAILYDRIVRAVVVLVLLAGCYDPSPQFDIPCGEGDACPRGQTCVAGFCRGSAMGEVDAPALDDAQLPDDAPDSGGGNVCSGGDSVCLVSCVATDPDCVTTCGDGKCVGNAGELCSMCAADCMTTAVVCGNGQCQPGESPNCFADCGPMPWTWAAEEQQLMTLVNNARTAGFTCPGGMAVTRPVYQISASLQAPAHEWVWEMSHHDYFGTNGAGCSGRTAAQRAMDGGYNGYVRSRGYADVQAAFNAWMASTTQCPIVMSTSQMAYIAVSYDTARSYILLLK